MKEFASLISEIPVEKPENIYRTTLAYCDSIMQCHFKLKKGGKIPLHNHEAVQCGYVLSGRVRFSRGSEDTVFTAQTGDSYVFSSKEYHGAQVLEDSEIIESFAPVRPEYIP